MRGAEVGVLRGSTSRVLLEHLPELHLCMVDLWETFAKDSEYYRSGDGVARLSSDQMASYLHEAETTTEFAEHRRSMMRMDSQTASTHVAHGSLDFVFIDADHTYEAVKADIHAWWPKIRPGGILSGHDYGGRRDRRGIWGVSRAANEFAKRRELEVHTGPGHVWWCKKPTGSERTASSTEGDGTLVRVLYGDETFRPELKRQVIASLRHQWCRTDILHVVAGKANAELLKSCGAERILQVSNKATFDPNGYRERYPKAYSWYPKAYLICAAMEEHPEILYTDFDCFSHKQPDSAMWAILRAKQGRFNGSLQASNIQYKGRVCLEVYRDRKVHPIRRCLQGSVVYCSDRKWIDAWMDAYTDLFDRGLLASIANDETVLMHMLDREYGVMNSDAMVENFEIPIVRVKRPIPEAQKMKDEQMVYFHHR